MGTINQTTAQLNAELTGIAASAYADLAALYVDYNASTLLPGIYQVGTVQVNYAGGTNLTGSGRFATYAAMVAAQAANTLPVGNYFAIDTQEHFIYDGATFCGSIQTGRGQEVTILANATAVSGSKMRIDNLVEKSQYKLVDEAGIWGGDTYAYFGISVEVDSTTVTSPVGAPQVGLFALLNNNNCGGDAVTFIADAVARTNDDSVFAANFVARNSSGNTNTKLVGLEIDIEPSVGTSVNSGSGALFINAFSLAIPVGIQFGGVGGGSFDIGIVFYGITDSGAAIAGGAGETMGSLINTGSSTYTDSAIKLSNTHRIRFDGAAGINPSYLYKDTSSNFRVLNGSAGSAIVFRDHTDTASILSISDTGILSFGTGAVINYSSAQTGTTVGATGAAAALPANPLGYLSIQVDGVARRVPFYN